MPRPIVHIGYHKTATTWFQKNFYPLVRNARFVARDRVRAAFLEIGAFHFDAEAARAALGVEAGESVILCEEGLSGYLHNGGLGGHLSRSVAERIEPEEARVRYPANVTIVPKSNGRFTEKDWHLLRAENRGGRAR